MSFLLQSQDKANTAAFMSGEVELSMKFDDEDELVAGAGAGTRNKLNKGKKSGRTSNGSNSAGKTPKILDIGVMIAGRLPSLMPRIETTLNMLRGTLSDTLETVLEQDPNTTQTYKKLVEKKVMEKDIDECIKSGKDPYGLGRTKTIYKCFYQFAKRAILVSLFVGDKECLHADLGFIESSDDENGSLLKEMVKQLGTNRP